MVAGSSGQAFMELQPDAQPVSCVRFAPRAIASSSAVAATVEGLYMLNLEHNPAGASIKIAHLHYTACALACSQVLVERA